MIYRLGERIEKLSIINRSRSKFSKNFGAAPHLNKSPSYSNCNPTHLNHLNTLAFILSIRLSVIKLESFNGVCLTDGYIDFKYNEKSYLHSCYTCM